jgi:hypothetical protein
MRPKKAALIRGKASWQGFFALSSNKIWRLIMATLGLFLLYLLFLIVLMVLYLRGRNRSG